MVATYALSQILKELSEMSGLTVDEIKTRAKINEPILSALLWMNSMGFVERHEGDSRHPVIDAKWTLTKAGRAYLSYTESHPSPAHTPPTFQLLFVAPPSLKKQTSSFPSSSIAEALIDLLGSARTEALVCSPFIDELVVPIVERIDRNVRIRMLTENASSPFFTRLVRLNPNIEVRYLKERSKGVQLYQVHAKFVCVDRKSAMIMSANINERSLYYNVELGVLVSDERIGAELASFFTTVFENSRKIGE